MAKAFFLEKHGEKQELPPEKYPGRQSAEEHWFCVLPWWNLAPYLNFL
jgi:hypothetical protein